MASQQTPGARDKDQQDRRAPARPRPLPQTGSPLSNVGLELVRDSHC